MAMMDDVKEILEKDRYYNGAAVGDVETCDNCGLYTLECISDVENEDTGVHTWLFRCPVCGFEDWECW